MKNKHGHGQASGYRGSEAKRFVKRIKVVGTCWLWIGRINEKGYGYFVTQLPCKNVRAHKWAWQKINGLVPDGFELDHLCRNRRCVRPSHCEPVTHSENMARGKWAMATHCVNGHEFTPENTYIRPSNGQRVCRTCDNNR